MSGKKRIIMDEINDAVSRGDYIGAAALEKERNQKIVSEGLPYAQTNNYGKYLEGTDYGERGFDLIRQGAPGEAVAAEREKRQQKTTVPGYTQYQNDAVDAKLGKYVDLQTAVNQPFTYENGASQLNARQKELDALYEGLRNYKKFEYNPETDPLYRALATQYTRNGRRAMDDTLAKVSARTGGLASSYAATAGNQAYGNYMSELSDRIPELTRLAYQMYNDEYNRKMNEAQMLQNRYDSELARYQADRNFAYGQYADDRNMAYGQLRDMVEGERYKNDERWKQQEWAYGVGRDKILDERYKNEWAYGVGRDKILDERYENEWAYGVEQDNKAEALALMEMGIMPPEETLKAAGIDSSYATSYVNGVKAQQAAAKSSGGGSSSRSSSGSSKSSGSSGSSTTSGKPTLTAAQARDAIADGVINDTTVAAYEYYYGQLPKGVSKGENGYEYEEDEYDVLEQARKDLGVDALTEDQLLNMINVGWVYVDDDGTFKRAKDHGSANWVADFAANSFGGWVN